MRGRVAAPSGHWWNNCSMWLVFIMSSILREKTQFIAKKILFIMSNILGEKTQFITKKYHLLCPVF